MLLRDQLQQLSFAHHRVGQVHPRELHLARMIDPKRLAEPIIKGAMVFKLERANRVCDPLDGIALTVSPVVHRINAPLVTGSMVMGVHDTIHHRISQIEIVSCHIDLGAQRSSTVGKLPCLHSLEQVQVLFDRPVAERAVLAGFSQSAAVLSHLLTVQIANKCLAIANQLQSPLIELFKVIGGVVESIPLESEPLHIRHDGLHVLVVFLGRVRVVKAKIASPAVGPS